MKELSRAEMKNVMAGMLPSPPPSQVVVGNTIYKAGKCYDFSDPKDMNGTIYQICNCNLIINSDGSIGLNEWAAGGCSNVGNIA